MKIKLTGHRQEQQGLREPQSVLSGLLGQTTGWLSGILHTLIPASSVFLCPQWSQNIEMCLGVIVWFGALLSILPGMMPQKESHPNLVALKSSDHV